MAVSGQVTVITPGIAVQGPSEPGSLFLLKAHPNNTGLVSLLSETSGSTSGFMMAAGDQTLRSCANLSGLYFDANLANQIAMWFKVEG